MNETTTTQIETPAVPPAPAGQEPPMIFLGIGVVINLVLVTAYFVWAARQGRKRDRSDD